MFGVTYHFDKLMQHQLSIVDNMVKSTIDLSNKSALIEINEIVEEYLKHCRSSASKLRI